MREPPSHLTADDVLAAVVAHWDARADTIMHLPVGFGAHHWRVDSPDAAYFVTLDALLPRHTAETLEAAYAGAATLEAAGLGFVLACLPVPGGGLTVPLAGGALSATRWHDGERGDGSETAGLLHRLHTATPPAGLPRWRPLVGPGLADELADLVRSPWDAGPHGEEARTAIRARLDAIAGWTADYHRLAARSDPATWVATHGEPHPGNQLRTRQRTYLVDWESLRLAPAERDLRSAALPGDEAMLAMFDVEWRLDEISQYAAWFAAPHSGTDDDRIALGGLVGELTR